MGGWLHTEINVRHWELNPDTVTHPTNRTRTQRMLTSLIETNALPLRQNVTGLDTVQLALSTIGPHNCYFWIHIYMHKSSYIAQTPMWWRPAWLSDNGVAHVNEVYTLRRARLVLGWVTVREFESRSHRLGM